VTLLSSRLDTLVWQLVHNQPPSLDDAIQIVFNDIIYQRLPPINGSKLFNQRPVQNMDRLLS
jgi:hypothetical protein